MSNLVENIHGEQSVTKLNADNQVDPTMLLFASQLSASLTRITASDNDIKAEPKMVENTLRLLLDALQQGEVKLDMSGVVTLSGFENIIDWKHALLDAGVAAAPGGYAPLIIDADALYLARYYHYHDLLHTKLASLAKQTIEVDDQDKVLEMLNNLFPTSKVSPDWQKVAAALALKKRLCVISGGPGTGKTTTVLRVLAALCSQNDKLRISLAAPTGKAAARMQESIRNNIEQLDCAVNIKEQLEVKASTLHRLLGYRYHSVQFKHNALNPLSLDVLVIDESSMIDTAMMAKCLDALPAHGQVILLGDKDQLAPVEAGSPFTDICAQAGFSQQMASELSKLTGVDLEEFCSDSPRTLADNLVFLAHSYRFDIDSGIGQLATSVNRGDLVTALSLMQQKKSDICWQEYDASVYKGYEKIKEVDPLITKIKTGFADYLTSLHTSKNTQEIFNSFTQFCILTATHNGHCGRVEINRLCQKTLGFPDDNHWYHGRPVMVTKNDYQTELYNGDVGICLNIAEHDATPSYRVFFPTSAGFKDYIPSRVPVHEVAFAMTVHKAQGSEFNEVLFLMPDKTVRVLTKALVYTAITRAKEKVELWGQSDVFLSTKIEC